MDATRLLNAFRDRWAKLGARQKQLAFLVGVPLVVAVTVAVVVLSRPSYSVLFSGLAANDAGAITAVLDRDKVPYRLVQGGATIMVPQAQVSSVRLKVAAGGLPRGGTVGFELMDQSKFGATDFERQVNYVRALSGELSRTITQISAVQNARVQLALPDPSPFLGRTTKPTAAVFVALKPGLDLDQSQVRGIVHLVASSVEKLAPEDVTVVDERGRLLSAGVDDKAGAAAASSMDVRKAFQNDLERSVRTLLEQVLGPGNVVVRVAADLSFDEKVVESTLFQPVTNKDGVLRSIQETDDVFQGTGTGATAPATGSSSTAPGSGTPTYQSATGSSGTTSQERHETTKNYEINQITQKLVVAPGAVQRLSIAVAVNRTLTSQESATLEKMVAAAIGADSARKDNITVTGVAFDTSLAQNLAKQATAEAAAGKRSRYMYIGAGAALAVAAAFVVMRRSAARRQLPSVEIGLEQAAFGPDNAGTKAAAKLYASGEEAAGGAGADGEKGKSLLGAPAVRPAIAAPPTLASPQLSQAAASRLQLLESIDKLVKSKPEVVAQLVRAWLAQE